MPEIKLELKEGTYKSFSGVQFTDNYLNKTALIYDYVSAKSTDHTNSKDIQSYMLSEYRAQESDIRTLISLLKKFGFINDFNEETTGGSLFTKEGELFVHIAKIKLNMDNLPSAFQRKINNAFSLILQNGFVYAQKNKENLDIPDNFWLLINLLKKIGTLSGKEYLYAIWCSNNKSLNEIASLILNNRKTEVDYVFIKEPGNTPIANTSYTYNFGLLVQAGVVDYIGNAYYKLTKDIFQ